MPDTEEKAVVKQRSPGGRFNALRHGLTAASVLLPYESAVSYGRLIGRLNRELKPEDGHERLLVSMLVQPLWRLRRLAAAEVGLFTRYAEQPAFRRPTADPRPAVQMGEALIGDQRPGAFYLLLRTRNSDTRLVLRVLRDLQEYRSARRAPGAHGG